MCFLTKNILRTLFPASFHNILIQQHFDRVRNRDLPKAITELISVLEVQDKKDAFISNAQNIYSFFLPLLFLL